MLKHFLKSALRFLKLNKVFTAINLFGLSVALAASFIILLYVINELSYDHYHKKWTRIYRVNTYYSDFHKVMATTPYILSTTLKNEYPQIEKSANTTLVNEFYLKGNNEDIRLPGTVGSSSEIFDIFTIPLIGNSKRDKLLDDLNSIVLSHKVAEKIFPGIDPVGKEIPGLVNGKENIFIVTGVFEDMPVNSTFRAQCFVNSKLTLDPINKTYNNNDAETNWQYDFWTTWILIKTNTKASELEKGFRVFEKKYINEKLNKNYRLQNLADIYLNSNIANNRVQGDIKNIRMFSAIAFVILLVAAINYIILSTAVSTSRTKEIGIRKTNGADNRSLRNQFLSESIILSIVVLPFALLFMWLALPFAGQLFQTKLNILSYNILTYILLYLALTLLIGIASGIYTSYYLSRLKIMQILMNAIHSGKNKQYFRSVLITLQLFIFCTFLSCSLIIRSQYKYALNKDYGYYKNDVMFVHLGPHFKGYSAFLDRIKSSQYVISASGIMQELPLASSPSYIYPHFVNKEKQIVVSGLAIDYDLLETMGLTLLKGRDFSKEFGGDLNKSVILNEEAVKQLGITEPIGQVLGSRTIIGVVKDFNLFSIHSDIPPLNIHISDDIICEVAIHYKHGTLTELLPFLKVEWEKVAPDKPFGFITIEDLILDIYSSEKNLITIVTIFSIFTILIAALGLLGLTLFVARTRTKEIGIRKIFGCSEHSIVFSFLKKNLILVAIASFVSIPVTLFIMSKWLSNFSSRIILHWWIFAISFLVSLIVVMLTVLIHAYRASRGNPVKALRYE
jgi:putative ABC transport system permease protein